MCERRKSPSRRGHETEDRRGCDEGCAMPTFHCVEPALVEGVKDCVMCVNPGNELLFPHVDVCMAIAFILANDCMVGGHVPGMWDENDFPPDINRNAIRIFDGMRAHVQLRGSSVLKLITLGDSEWDDTMNTIGGRLGGAEHLRIHKEVDGGVDLSLNGRRKMLFCCNSKAKKESRGQTIVKGTQILLQMPFDAISSGPPKIIEFAFTPS